MSAFCKVCKGVLELIGILGRREHVRCKACGLTDSRPVNVLRDESGINLDAAELLE